MTAAPADTAIETSTADSRRYAVCDGVRRLAVGGQPLLHVARTQQLFELNATADRIWRDLANGASPEQAAERLIAAGAAADDACDFVQRALWAWMRQGALLPAQALRALAAEPAARRTLRLDELALELAFHGDVDVRMADDVFGQLYGPVPAGARRLTLVGVEGLTFFFFDGVLRATAEPDAVAAQLKALLTDLYVSGVEDAFLAHGALLSRNGRTVFLSGAPGAGKTTLTLALCADGWAYGGDDIVRFEPDGRVRGAPFAAAVKRGAWPLVGRYWPQIEDLPTWMRADGQETRYLAPPPLARRESRDLDAVLLLDRRPGAAAQLDLIPPAEALTAVLDSAYAARWRMTGETLEALGRRLEAIVCGRLVYSDLDAARACLGALADA